MKKFLLSDNNFVGSVQMARSFWEQTIKPKHCEKSVLQVELTAYLQKNNYTLATVFLMPQIERNKLMEKYWNYLFNQWFMENVD